MSKTKIILGVVVIGLVVAALAMSDSSLFKGTVSRFRTLTLNTTVINDDGGMRGTGDFLFEIVKRENDLGRNFKPFVTPKNLQPGRYWIRKQTTPLGYVSVWGGDCDASGSVVLDGNKTCTITINDIPVCSVANNTMADMQPNSPTYDECICKTGFVDLGGVDANGQKICVPEVLTCEDNLLEGTPGDGVDYSTPATVSKNQLGQMKSSGNDTCDDDGKLIEIYCRDDNRIAKRGPVECAEGMVCLNGACVARAEEPEEPQGDDQEEAVVGDGQPTCPDGSPMTPGVPCPCTDNAPRNPNNGVCCASRLECSSPWIQDPVTCQCGCPQPQAQQQCPGGSVWNSGFCECRPLEAPIVCDDNDVAGSSTFLGTVTYRRGDVIMNSYPDSCSSAQAVTEFSCEGGVPVPGPGGAGMGGQNSNPMPEMPGRQDVSCPETYVCEAGVCRPPS